MGVHKKIILKNFYNICDNTSLILTSYLHNIGKHSQPGVHETLIANLKACKWNAIVEGHKHEIFDRFATLLRILHPHKP
jgi:hypothetical protein